VLIIILKPKCGDGYECAVDITLNEVEHCSSMVMFYDVMLITAVWR